MDNARLYKGKAYMEQNAISELKRMYDAKEFETQIVTTDIGDTLLQIKKSGIRNAVGMSKGISVLFEKKGEDLKISLVNAKWADKAVVMSISMIILWPLAITSGIGIYHQNKFKNEVWENIELMLGGSI